VFVFRAESLNVKTPTSEKNSNTKEVKIMEPTGILVLVVLGLFAVVIVRNIVLSIKEKRKAK